jgi:hypothetical protein
VNGSSSVLSPVVARNEVTQQSSLSFLSTVEIASSDADEKRLAKTLSVVARNKVTRQSSLSSLSSVEIASVDAIERRLAKTWF